MTALSLAAAACDEPLTGPDAQRAFSEARVRIREVPEVSEATIVFLDGERLPPGWQLEGSPLNRLDPKDIERIEIVKGEAAARLLGAEAKGGVIRVFTKAGSGGHVR